MFNIHAEVKKSFDAHKYGERLIKRGGADTTHERIHLEVNEHAHAANEKLGHATLAKHAAEHLRSQGHHEAARAADSDHARLMAEHRAHAVRAVASGHNYTPYHHPRPMQSHIEREAGAYRMAHEHATAKRAAEAAARKTPKPKPGKVHTSLDTVKVHGIRD